MVDEEGSLLVDRIAVGKDLELSQLPEKPHEVNFRINNFVYLLIH